MKILFAVLFGLFVSISGHAANPVVEMQTNQGNVRIELYPDKAPITVANFLQHVNEGFYDGTIFHRVISGFALQGGGYLPDLTYKPSKTTGIACEAKNGLTNEMGTIAMARGKDLDSATTQFFINLDSNKFLNHYKDHPDYFGYAVFGKVTEGMDVLKKIASLPTKAAGPFKSDVPVEPIIVQRVALLPETKTPPPSQPKKGKSHGKTANQSGHHLAGN